MEMESCASMRTFLLLAAALAGSVPATAATRNFGITDFDKVRVDGPFKVTLTTGVAPFARAIGSADALDRIAIEVEGDTLVVHTSIDSWSSYPGEQSGPVEIALGTHDLGQAWLNGSGALAINRIRGLKFDLAVQGSGVADIADTNVDQLNVSVIGTASARLAGKAGKLTALVRGVSNFDGASLATTNAAVGGEGSATIAANVSDSVTIDAKGPTTVHLSGHPACTVRASGSASVSGCR